MNKDQSSYRQIFKSTSLFGGVQVFNIILSIIRSKVIAILLGPAGMGLAGLFTATTGLIASLTNFGLGTSAVRNIAMANESREELRLTTVVKVFQKLVWFTGTFGLIITLLFSSLLSELTFGNDKYTYAFIWLSLTLLFNQLTQGQDVLLQGMRKLNHLAKANMVGSFLGLLISLPLYYFYRIDGVVPALILSSIATTGVAWYFARQVKLETIKVGYKEVMKDGSDMLRMGFMMSLGGLIAMGASYVVRIYISKRGGILDVGLYNAGFTIISTYVGLIFTAMGTDFYPRLSSVAGDNKKASLLINHQAEIAILILAPILSVFLIFINIIVILLYSSDFIAINSMIHWAALGMYFKAVSWSIGFIILAKGDSKTFFWSELLSNAYLLLLNILGYKFFGLQGLGVSFMLGYMLNLIQVYVIAATKFEFNFGSSFYKIFSIQFLLGLSCFFIANIFTPLLAYVFGTIIIIGSAIYSLFEMNKRINIRDMLKRYVKR